MRRRLGRRGSASGVENHDDPMGTKDAGSDDRRNQRPPAGGQSRFLFGGRERGQTADAVVAVDQVGAQR